MTTETTATPTVKPTLGQPEYDEGFTYEPIGADDAPAVEPPSVGWDLSMGSRINFHPDADGTGFEVLLNLSDDAIANGLVNRSVTREQVLAFAEYLVHLVQPTPPKRPAAVDIAPDWRTAVVVGLTPCQFGATAMKAPEPPYDDIHLVRESATGTPGPTLCGIDRFAKGGPGWGMGIGYVRTGTTPTGCVDCGRVAAELFPDAPIHGLGRHADLFVVSVDPSTETS